MFKAIAPVKIPKLLKFAFILLPFAEIAGLIIVGMVIGWLPTLLLIGVTSGFGIWLIKHYNPSAIMNKRVPEQLMKKGAGSIFDVMDMSVYMMAGILLVLPGFITDVIGLLMLLPPCKRMVAKRTLGGDFGAFKQAAQNMNGFGTKPKDSNAANDPKVIEGEYWRHDDENGDKKSD